MSDPAHASCPFCQKSSADFFMESEHFGAIYNIAPILPGHSLIIPKFHHTKMITLEDEFLSEMMLFSKRVAKLLCEVFKSEEFDWAIQEGASAGQSVEHMHLHLLPRNPGDLDDPGAWYREIEKNHTNLDVFERRRISDEELMKITKRLREVAIINNS